MLPAPPLFGLLNVITVDDEPLHNTWFAIAFTVAVGLTVIVNVIAIPVQLTPPLVNVGVTVIVAVTGDRPMFVAVNDGILPEPLAAIPIDGVLLIQLNVTVPPVAGLPKIIAFVDDPLHNTWFDTALTVAIGFTVMVNEIGTPTQPDGLTGVTVIVAVIALVKLLAVVNDGIFPVPLGANPIAGLLFTQLYIVPATVLLNKMGDVV